MSNPRDTAIFEQRVKHVYRMLCEAAAAGRLAPTNADIAAQFQIRSGSNTTRYVSELEQRGMIAVERLQSGRIITILETGDKTAAPAVELRPYKTHPTRHSAYHSPEAIAQRTSERDAERDRLSSIRTVDRTPCRVCGIRADIGCKHTRGETRFDDRTYTEGRKDERTYRAKLALRLGISERDVLTIFDLGVGETARLASEVAARS